MQTLHANGQERQRTFELGRSNAVERKVKNFHFHASNTEESLETVDRFKPDLRDNTEDFFMPIFCIKRK